MKFTVYVHPEPQGSARAFVHKGTNRAIITSDNKKLKPFRQEMTRTAMAAVGGQAPLAAKHEPVRLNLDFYLAKPASVAKKRQYPVVKPDLDKLLRATMDSLTGVLFLDDAQVIECRVRKLYDAIERVEVEMESVAPLFAPTNPAQEHMHAN